MRLSDKVVAHTPTRHIAADALGLPVAVVVTVASVQDSTAGKQLLDAVAAEHRSVSKVWADGGYNAGFRTHGARLGIDRRGGTPYRAQGLPRAAPQMVVERTFGWLVQHRRLVRDYGNLL